MKEIHKRANYGLKVDASLGRNGLLKAALLLIVMILSENSVCCLKLHQTARSSQELLA